MAEFEATSSQTQTGPRRGATWRTRIVTVLAAIAIVGVAVGVVWVQSAKYQPLTVGMQAPDFELPGLDGETMQLSELRGKVVFLNFWATWCKPCVEEMPSIEVLYKKFKDDGLVVLAVSIDRVTTKQDIPEFVNELNLTFPILVDSWGQTDKEYKLMGVPETYIIDRQGILREKVIGPRDWSRLDNLRTVRQLLKGGTTAATQTDVSST